LRYYFKLVEMLESLGYLTLFVQYYMLISYGYFCPWATQPFGELGGRLRTLQMIISKIYSIKRKYLML
jgi:hypothetical protein